MIFFYGMRQYGKDNVSSRFGICESCGHSVHLSTYTTARFLHLYWIPLIPVGHTKYIDVCPLCDRCRTTSPGKYKKLRKKSIDAAFSKLKEQPNDPEVVIEGLSVLSAYNEEELFEKLANTYTGTLAGNKDVQMAMAFGFYRMGHFTQAAAAAREAEKLGAGEDAVELVKAATDQEKQRQTDHPKPPKQGRVPIFLPYLVPALIILSILGSYLGKGFTAGKARKIWLVNGTMTSYTINIDSKTVRLEPFSPKRIQIPMGEHTVYVNDTRLPVEPFSINYKRSFGQRLTDKNVLVLNPDGMAFLVNESIPYVSHTYSNKHDPQSEYTYYFGKQWHVIKSIDYEFRDVPDNIDMPSATDITYKTLLTVYEPNNYSDVIAALDANGTLEDMVFFANQAVLFDPASTETTWLLRLAKGTNELADMAIMETGLSHRPIITEFHRFYQTTMEVEQPEHDLKAEYRKLLDAEPDSAQLKYLLGRILDNDDALDLFLAAEDGEGCGGYGYYALAYHYLCGCNFKKALSFAEKAVASANENEAFRNTRSTCYMATKEYGELVKETDRRLRQYPLDGELIAMKIRYLCMSGNSTEADKVETAYFQQQEFRDDTAKEEWRNYFKAIRCCAKNDMMGYLDAMTAARHPNAEYEKALWTGDISTTLNILKQEDNADYSAYLIVHCAANYSGNEAIANEALELAVELAPDRDVADMLTGKKPVTPESLLRYEMLPEYKRVMACTLGYANGGTRDQFFKLARTCNFTPGFMNHQIGAWTAKKQL